MDRRYTAFLGGLPDTASVIPDSVATKAPYIGCMRDVLLVPRLTDFNEVSYKAGVELGTCKSEMPDIGGMFVQEISQRCLILSLEFKDGSIDHKEPSIIPSVSQMEYGKTIQGSAKIIFLGCLIPLPSRLWLRRRVHATLESNFFPTLEAFRKPIFPSDDEDPSEDTATEGAPAGANDKEDGDGEDDDDQNPWSITEAPQTSDRYGECLMPVTPTMDPDLSPQSGMRFGKTVLLRDLRFLRSGLTGFDTEMRLICPRVS